jgi:hypothetical protein
MVRLRPAFALVALIALVAFGCSSRTETASETTSDSLLASSPIEQSQGDITPQTDYQPAPESQEPPAPAPVEKKPASKPKPVSKPKVEDTKPAEPAGQRLASGTPIAVSVATAITTETAVVGDTWTGTVKDNVIVGNTVVIPAGSTVNGVIVVSKPAEKGSRALLGLAVKSISVNGEEHMVHASTENIEAGSTRARNIGAVAGAAAAGALIGKAAGGGKGALIGGLLGGAAAGTGVAASKGYQVVIKEGTAITFSVDQDVLVRS